MRKKVKKQNRKQALRQQTAMIGQIVIGLLLYALGYKMFLIPNDIAPGGFTGIGQLVGHLTGLRVGMITLVLNIPLFLVSTRTFGYKFIIRSALVTAAASMLLDYLPVPAVIPLASAERLMPASIFGGVLAGAGLGLVIRGGATTGGSDLSAQLIHEKFSFASVGAVMFLIDGLVIVASGFVFDVLSAMFALITAFLMSFLADYVVTGLNSAHAYFIISSKSGAVAGAVIERLSRGATVLYGQGAYERKEQEVLLCVVSRLETVRLRAIVSEIDPAAFMIATRAQEVLGKGFTPHKRGGHSPCQ